MATASVVLAGGLGARMLPLTAARPKPLLPVLGRTLLEHAVGRLAGAGADEVFVNVFHQAEALGDFVRRRAWPVPVTIRREETLTGPAGALRLFPELKEFDTVLVTSGDVVADEDLRGLVERHGSGRAALTFGAIRRYGARNFGVLEVDGDGRVTGAVEKPDVPDDQDFLISAGIYCLRPEALDLIDPHVSQDYAKDLAPKLLAAGETVLAHPLAGYWRDVGSPRALLEVNLDAVAGRIRGLEPAEGRERPAGAHPGADVSGPVWLGPGCRIGQGAVVRGPVVLGPDAEVGAGAWVQDAVVLPGGRVPEHGVVLGAVVDVAGSKAPA